MACLVIFVYSIQWYNNCINAFNEIDAFFMKEFIDYILGEELGRKAILITCWSIVIYWIYNLAHYLIVAY